MEHILKSEQPYFQAVWDKRKNFEIRCNDRGFKAGDSVVLKELDEREIFTRRYIYAKISYVTAFKQQDNYVVFGMRNIRNWEQGI